MRLFRKNPLFFSMILLLGVIFVIELVHLARLSARLSQVETLHETKSTQYSRYLRILPSPTRANLQALQENYSELHEVFRELMQSLNLSTYDRAEFFGETPASRADWSFALHKYKESARYSALSNGIELAASESFGVGDVSDGGPSEGADAMHQQIVIMSSLLDALFDSGIKSFVSIQRGLKPEGRGRSASQRSSSRGRKPVLVRDPNLFVVQETESLAVPGFVDSQLFRIVFTGQSHALRDFLNRVSNASLPFVVRGVEAGLSSEGGAKDGLESFADSALGGQAELGEDEEALAIISDNFSVYTVTLEFLDLAVEISVPEASGMEVEPSEA